MLTALHGLQEALASTAPQGGREAARLATGGKVSEAHAACLRLCQCRCAPFCPPATALGPLLLQRIMSVKYSFPANLHLSRECLDLISRIFVANPAQRISIAQIKQARGARKSAHSATRCQPRSLQMCRQRSMQCKHSAPPPWSACARCNARLRALLRRCSTPGSCGICPRSSRWAGRAAQPCRRTSASTLRRAHCLPPAALKNFKG